MQDGNTLADEDALEIETPRARMLQRQPLTSAGSDLGSRSNASSGASPPKRSLSMASSSRTSSPSKQARHTQFDINGFHRFPFPLPGARQHLPQSLQMVLAGLKDIAQGQTQLPIEWIDSVSGRPTRPIDLLVSANIALL
jgi:hypothetical protein